MRMTIRKELRKNPVALIAKLAKQCDTPEAQASMRLQLEAIARNLALEIEKTEERKRISKRIGEAKKANEHSAELISQASSISAQLNNIKETINAQVSMVEAQLTRNTNEISDTKKTMLPLHLRQNNHDDNAELDGETLSTSHTAVITSEKWQQFVESIEQSTIYHDARWMPVIEKTFRHKFYAITCTNSNNKLIGVLPLVHLNSRVFGSFTLSIPYVNYGGPLALSPKAEQALMSHAAKLSKDLGCSHMEIRETRPRNGWQSVQRKVSMILPLPACDEILDANLGTKLRAQVNKARHHGLSVSFGGVELLDAYYQVFSLNMRDLGTPVYSKTVFKEILLTFPDNAFLAIAELNGTPLAVGFLLGYRDKLEIPWASSVRKKNYLGANMLMYREILKEAIERNYQYFDFGRSTKGAATHRFKKQWGAKEHDLHWHYWTRDGQGIPELNPDNPKFKLAIKLWQKLPVAITRIIGPGLARNLP